MKEYPHPERVLGRILEDKVLRVGDKHFLRFVDGPDLTYRQFDQMVNRVANGLSALGLGKNGKVLLMLPNCPEFLYVWFAASKLGAVEVPLNTALRGEGLKYQINWSDAEIMVVDHRMLRFVKLVEPELTNVKTLIVYDGKGRDKNEPQLHFRTLPFDELLEYPPDRPGVDVQYTDIAAILYTSGTTGLSKGVTICHNYLYEIGFENVKYCRYTDEDVLYTGLPFFHGNAQGVTIMPALLAEATAVIAERFSASNLWQHVREYDCTAFNYIGGILPILFKQPESPDDRNHRVRVSMGAAAPANIWEAFEKRFGLKLIEVFGLTECFCVTVMPWDQLRVGSCGKAITGYDVKIFDDHDNEVAPRTVGEFVVRPLRPYLGMSGYYKRPEATLEANRGLWFHTGDYGYVDEDGYFYFVDRKKDAIRRRGENISSYEVEKVLNAHPKVLESAIVAAPSEVGEDEVKACIVLKPGESMAPEELIEFCEPRLAYFAIPRYVEFRESLPKTPSERVEKYKLKEEGITPACWDREKAGYRLKRVI